MKRVLTLTAVLLLIGCSTNFESDDDKQDKIKYSDTDTAKKPKKKKTGGDGSSNPPPKNP